MLTVAYADEPPVSYLRPKDRVILETLKYELGLTIREVYPMVQEMIRLCDPIIADGDVFEFDGLLGVPAPRDKVDFIAAMQECGRQIKTCEMLLSGDGDRAAAVLINSISWLAFWKTRAPTPELRDRFDNSLGQLLEGLGRLLERCSDGD
jgi:hypothetical protein